ncbi:MAG: NepR family anti-sigma factor [Allosphingosinicella sp.]
MAFEIDEDERDRRPKSASEPDDMHGSNTPARKKAGASGVGNALREAYQEALREDVPPEMLDLLGKLG